MLLYAIASAESSLDARAINRNRDGSHDIGLMQINSMHLPDLARQGITRQRLLDEPCLSIDGRVHPVRFHQAAWPHLARRWRIQRRQRF